MAIKIQGDTVIYDDKVFKVGSGTTAQRPSSPALGMMWYNTDLGAFEGYNGTAWVPVGASLGTPLAVVGNSTSGSEIRLPEDTDNGSNYVSLKAPDTLASNLTLTLPSADGTSGQVLQTNGSGQLSFATASSGTQQFTSSGSITAGRAVSINTNGTVSATTGVQQDATFGTVSSLFQNARSASYYDTTTGWHIVALAKIDSSYEIYVYTYKVNADGSVSGGNGAYLGTPGSGYGADVLRITKDTVNNVYGIGVYGYYGYTSIMFAEMTNTTTGAITSRGQTYISYNTPYRYWAMSLCFDTYSSRFVMAYVNSGNTLSFAAIDYVTKSVTASTSVSTAANSGSTGVALAANPASNNMLVAYNSSTYNDYPHARVISLNSAGTAFTIGNENNFGYVGPSGAWYMAYFPSVSRYVVQVIGSGGSLYTYLLNTSGSQISISTSAPSNAGSYFQSYPIQSGPDFTNNRLYSLSGYSSVQTVFYYDITASNITYGGVLGTSSSSPALSNNAAISYDGANSRALLVSYYSANASMAVRGFLPPVSYTNADKFVGFSTQSVATGQPVTVTVLGGVNTNQTGLTTSTAYYLRYDGTLVATTTPYGIVARALSATSLQVTPGGAFMKLVSQTTITGNPASVTVSVPSGYQQLQIVFQSLQARGTSSYITITGTNSSGSDIGFYGHGVIGSSTSTAGAFATSSTLFPHGSSATVSDYGTLYGYLTMNTAYSNPAFIGTFNTSATSSGAVFSTIAGYVSSYPTTLKIAPNSSGYWGGGAIYIYGIG